ncbi:DUF3977 family protein [Paenibacillus koleovorans]|uniref:DUF3977 family protein n=1 Tax=Paenibacillus koleovorans TaxID=121608 RepID=UPI0027D866A8|nr:DUF3977 family protein [Paenibacillus koleovorans]
MMMKPVCCIAVTFAEIAKFPMRSWGGEVTGLYLLGNTWIIRTETELDDGSESKQEGIVKPKVFRKERPYMGLQRSQ